MTVRAHFQKHGPKYAGAATGAAIAAAAFIAPWEGYEPVAKHERIDPAAVITWCYGRTNYDDPSVAPGTRFTKPECEKFLAEDMPRYMEPLRGCIPGFDAMPQPRQVAFTSAAYNLGDAAVCRSSMARKINVGDVQGACDAFLAYDRANGKVIRGLQRRREAERELCLREG